MPAAQALGPGFQSPCLRKIVKRGCILLACNPGAGIGGVLLGFASHWLVSRVREKPYLKEIRLSDRLECQDPPLASKHKSSPIHQYIFVYPPYECHTHTHSKKEGCCEPGVVALA